MTNIFVQKWRICGESKLYDSKSEAVKGRGPGTILESVVVLEADTDDPEEESYNENGKESEE